MADTVKAVTGLNLEYSRFSLPTKTNPIAVTTVSNPDCNCSPSDAQYQFPVNWDTGPEKLDVFFYPRNYSGSEYALFNGNQGLSRNFTPTYSGFGCYIEDAVDNPYTPITLTKTENVFKDHPDIPKKRVASTDDGSNTIYRNSMINSDSSFAVFHDTHANISRKCWAGTATLGEDEVLVIYSYSKKGISIVLCYLEGASTECIHDTDESHGPHSVMIDLTPGTHFGSKWAFTSRQNYLFNDSYYNSLDMGGILNYYTFNNPSVWGNNYNGTTSWGLDTSFGNGYNYYNWYYGSQVYVDTNYYTNHYQTSFAPYVKDAPLAGTSNWYCVSGRPQSVNHNMIDANIPNTRNTTQSERDDCYKNCGTGIDGSWYYEIYWQTIGAVAAIPEVSVLNCYGTKVVLAPEQPARAADEEPDWENPFVYLNPRNTPAGYVDELSDLIPVFYNLNPYYSQAALGWAIIPTTPIGAYGNYQSYSNWFSNYYNTTNTGPRYCAGSFPNIFYYGYYGSFYRGPFSNGNWTINPNTGIGSTKAVTVACGSPQVSSTYDDGTETHLTITVASLDVLDVTYPVFGILPGPAQAAYTYNCSDAGGYWGCGGVYPPLGVVGSVPSKYTRVVYKVIHTNMGINLTPPQTTPLVYEPDAEFPLYLVDREYVREPGCLLSTYYGSIKATARKPGKTSYAFGNTSCNNYSMETFAFYTYPGGGDSSDLIVSNCDKTNPVTGTSSNAEVLNLEFKSSYVPYFFSGVRPSEGLVYPPNLTEPKVRIFTTDPPDPEEFRDSNYPKYYFQEFDPSTIMVSKTRTVSIPPLTVTNPITPNTKMYLPDYETSTTKTTILPRATSMLQTVAEQTEYFQCQYLLGEFNDNFYYFPPSFLKSVTDIEKKLDFPEDLQGCVNNLTNYIPWFYKSAFLFDPSKGEEQKRSAGYSFNTSTYYNGIYSSSLDYPEVTKRLYEQMSEEVENRVSEDYPIPIPAYLYYNGNTVYENEMVYHDMGSMPGMPGYGYCSLDPTSRLMGGSSDICSPPTSLAGSCGYVIKKVEPTYSVTTLGGLFNILNGINSEYRAALEAAITKVKTHTKPLNYSYDYVSSYTSTGTYPYYSCTSNMSTINILDAVVFADTWSTSGSLFGSNAGSQYWGYHPYAGTSAIWFQKSLPVYGNISGYIDNSYYGTQIWGQNQDYINCEVLMIDTHISDRKETLEGNYLQLPGYNNGYYSYNSNVLIVSDISAPAQFIRFADAGDLMPPDDSCINNGSGNCAYPKLTVEFFYKDVGTFTNYLTTTPSYPYPSGLTGSITCLSDSNIIYNPCVTGETIQLYPDFPVSPPMYNPCDPATYMWVEACTRYYS